MPGQALQGEGLSEQAVGSSTAQLVQTCPRQPPSQGTACGHAASHSSNTRAVHETQAPGAVKEKQEGREGDTATSGFFTVARTGSQGKPLSQGAWHKPGHMPCSHLSTLLTRDSSCLTQPSPLEAAFISLKPPPLHLSIS